MICYKDLLQNFHLDLLAQLKNKIIGCEALHSHQRESVIITCAERHRVTPWMWSK